MNIKENIKTLIIKKPLKLDCGQTISNFPLAYETYGSLNNNKDNAILVFHALTGDQFCTNINPITTMKPSQYTMGSTHASHGIGVPLGRPS